MARNRSGSKEGTAEDSASQSINARIEELVAAGDWRGQALARLRTLILQADAGIVEEVKWRKPSNPPGVPVWSHPACGMICTGEMYKDKVKLTFAKGAALEDPSGLFNASLDGAARRAIDLREGDKINEKALAALIRAAIALDAPGASGGAAPPRFTVGRAQKRSKKA